MRVTSQKLKPQDKSSRVAIKLIRRETDHGRFLLQKATACLLAFAMLPMGLGTALAQDDGPPPPPDEQGQPLQNYRPLVQDQLNQLVAPIALYPDSLVAQVLAASTYPAQVVAAAEFVQQNGNYPADQLASFANTQPWDPSVKSLVAFPSVLADLSQNMDWTTQLGNAYYNQPQDVLGSVQIMRERAYEAGNLRSSPQYSVVYDPGNIVIAPASPEIVYVPYYNPWVVFGAPIAVYPHYYYGPPRGIVFGAGLAIGFGIGIAIGAFGHYNWGYHSWGPSWGSRTVVFNHNTYISRSVTVVNHGYYGHFDRTPQARAFNQQQAAHFEGNRMTVNNVTIKRGGGSIDRNGNSFQNSGNIYDRGASPYSNGGNNNDRSQQGFSRNATTQQNGNLSRAPQLQPGTSFNRAPQQTERPGVLNRSIYGGAPQVNRYQSQPMQRQLPAPQQGVSRPQPSLNPRQPQQHAEPTHGNGGSHAEHEGHEQHH